MTETIIQWTQRSGAFVTCGATRRRLDAGIYDCIDIGYGNWGLRLREQVSDDLIDIPGTVADEIYTDIDAFMACRTEYELYGLTHKRGYLFYGPPGSGKTSLAIQLARRFVAQDGIVVAVGASEHTFYNAVELLRQGEPKRPKMFILEEADEFIDAGLALSILDGEQSISGAVYIASTNYREKLPPRIVNRPGRFDRVVYVGAPPRAVQIEYLRRIAGRGPLGETDVHVSIVDALEGIPLSIAHLREAFIAHVMMKVPMTEVRGRFEAMANDPIQEFLDDESISAEKSDEWEASD